MAFFSFSRDCKFASGIDLSLSHGLHLITMVQTVVADKCLLHTYSVRSFNQKFVSCNVVGKCLLNTYSVHSIRNLSALIYG